MSKINLHMGGPACPCCFNAFAAKTTADAGSETIFECATCDPADVTKALAEATATADGTPLPPIRWLTTPAEIEALSDEIVAATYANLDAVAAVPLDAVTFENVMGPLMHPPNYKTNPQIAASKFLQHCSTDEAVREAASKAGAKFAETRVAGRMRADVYKVRDPAPPFPFRRAHTNCAHVCTSAWWPSPRRRSARRWMSTGSTSSSPAGPTSSAPAWLWTRRAAHASRLC
jgi:hypothetical protein